MPVENTLDDVLAFLSIDGRPHTVTEIALATNTTKIKTQKTLKVLSTLEIATLRDGTAMIDPKTRKMVLDELK
jgi:hypothetical protein